MKIDLPEAHTIADAWRNVNIFMRDNQALLAQWSTRSAALKYDLSAYEAEMKRDPEFKRMVEIALEARDINQRMKEMQAATADMLVEMVGGDAAKAHALYSVYFTEHAEMFAAADEAAEAQNFEARFTDSLGMTFGLFDLHGMSLIRELLAARMEPRRH